MGDQYVKGTRSSYALANWIRSPGYKADPYPGPSAGALLLILPAIAAGLGELGSMAFSAARASAPVRLAGVTTDMLLSGTAAPRFGGDEFCRPRQRFAGEEVKTIPCALHTHFSKLAQHDRMLLPRSDRQTNRRGIFQDVKQLIT